MLRSVIDAFGTAFCRSCSSFVGFAMTCARARITTPVVGAADRECRRTRNRWRAAVGRSTPAIAIALAAAACEPVDEPSRLEQRASQPAGGTPAKRSEVEPGGTVRDATTKRTERGAVADAATPKRESPPSETELPPTPPPDPAPPPPSERVTLALALDPAITYRTSVVGMVSFPMNDKPTGYAREETVTLSDCDGEGAQRKCTLTHRFTGFQAEPPAGRFLEGDYNRVAHVQTAHPITGTGIRATPGVLTSTEADTPIDDVLTAELGEVHRLFCIRFPDEPVGVGAKWSDTCRAVTAGTVGKRTVTWELSKLVDDPGGTKRAELSYVGQYVQTLFEKGRTVERTGTISGVLYFFVDAGQPHLMREKIAVPLGRTGVVTQTSVNIQFAREDPADSAGRLRTDGAPFPPRPAGAPAPG